jgi:hypothetical protein
MNRELPTFEREHLPVKMVLNGVTPHTGKRLDDVLVAS